MQREQQLLDEFAKVALNALMAKSPFFDTKGELGKEITKEELADFMKNITETAYGYASWALIAREKQKSWLEANEGRITY